MATLWVYGEFDAESSGSVKIGAQRGIKGPNFLFIVCLLVHVLPTAIFCRTFE